MPRFDRILSIEVSFRFLRLLCLRRAYHQLKMFEHMKNYQTLLRKVSTWLRPKTTDFDEDSLLFIHIFCHRTTPYHFESEDGWMAQNFFSGSLHPLDSSRSSSHLCFKHRWNNAIPRPFCEKILSFARLQLNKVSSRPTSKTTCHWSEAGI
jgi:hypothetical protein